MIQRCMPYWCWSYKCLVLLFIGCCCVVAQFLFSPQFPRIRYRYMRYVAWKWTYCQMLPGTDEAHQTNSSNNHRAKRQNHTREKKNTKKFSAKTFHSIMWFSSMLMRLSLAFTGSAWQFFLLALSIHIVKYWFILCVECPPLAWDPYILWFCEPCINRPYKNQSFGWACSMKAYFWFPFNVLSLCAYKLLGKYVLIYVSSQHHWHNV